MIRSRTIKLLIIVFLYAFTIGALAGTERNASYNRLIIFGDSLSDTGNLASVAGSFPSPPYYMNRVSNGPVAVEVFAEKLGLTAEASLHLIGPAVADNYAIANADAISTDPADLGPQVIAFLANNGYVAPSDALYVVMIGGNDIRTERFELDRSLANAAIDEAASQVKQALETLILAGARSFFLVNAPNIAIIPETSLIALTTGDVEVIKRARRLSNRYRIRLKQLAKSLDRQHGAQVIDFDLFKVFNKIVRKAEKFGFTNSTEACFSGITNTFNPGCEFGLNFDKYVFFDEIHPTAKTHALIGTAFYKALIKSDYDLDKWGDKPSLVVSD